LAAYVSGTVERIDRKITVRMFVEGPTNHDYYDHCGRRSAAVDFSTRIQLER
jgi:hypothetical protein